jgi:hypothetical protein
MSCFQIQGRYDRNFENDVVLARVVDHLEAEISNRPMPDDCNACAASLCGHYARLRLTL